MTVAQAFSDRLRGLWALRQSSGAQRAFRASAWSFAGYGLTTALRFVSRLVLAKMLHIATPMGDVAIVMVILGGLEMISDLGIGLNIVQHRRGEDLDFLGTAFSLQAIRGVGMWAIASMLAVPIAGIYHAPQLAGLILFGALATLFRSFVNPGIWVLTRQVDLRGPTLLTAAAEVSGFAVTVGWSILAPSAWAIVAGTVAGAAAYMLGSHLLSLRVRFAWNREVARGIAKFGGWMILSSATYFMSSRGESLMLRGSVPDVEFGCFAFASMLVTTPVAAITQLASQVFLPTLASSIREDAEKATRQYVRSKWLFTGLAICFACGGLWIGPILVGLLGLNRTFVGLAWMVQLLGVRASVEVYGAPIAQALLASGASRYCAAANIVRLIVLVGGLYFTVGHWGLRGAMWVLVSAPFVSYLAFVPGLQRHMAGTMRIEVIASLLFLAVVSVATAVSFAFQ